MPASQHTRAYTHVEQVLLLLIVSADRSPIRSGGSASNFCSTNRMPSILLDDDRQPTEQPTFPGSRVNLLRFCGIFSVSYEILGILDNYAKYAR